jgi:predicted Zn-ribbon and HTH transcriptional regulator
MGVITDILKGIPLTAVLKERLAEQEAAMAALKTENTILKAENAVLKAKYADCQTKLQNFEREKTIQGDSCPYCQQPKGKLLDIQPHHIFGETGVKVYYYQCENCGKKYDKEQGR